MYPILDKQINLINTKHFGKHTGTPLSPFGPRAPRFGF